MSRLDELIAKYCPDGVEYRKLGDFATVSRGGNFQKKDFVDAGVPCIHYGQIYTRYGLFADSTFTFISEDCAVRQKIAEHGDIVMAVTSENIEDVCKCVGWLGTDRVAVSGHSAIIHHDQDTKYLTYWFHSEMFSTQKKKLAHGTKVIEVTPDALLDVVIPVPPIEVQQEIARILDDFTERTAVLGEALKAELNARQKQYKHYALSLFENAEGVEPTTLDAVSENCDYKRKPVTSKKREAGDIPYYGASGIVDYVKDYIFDGDYLLISEDGANLIARSTPIAFSISGKTWVNNHAHILKFESMVTQKYVERYLNFLDLTPYITGAAQPKLSQKNLNLIQIPLPPIDEQERIMAILDRFDTASSDVTDALSAEITARQKQYEYYRDKLLTFKPAV